MDKYHPGYFGKVRGTITFRIESNTALDASRRGRSVHQRDGSLVAFAIAGRYEALPPPEEPVPLPHREPRQAVVAGRRGGEDWTHCHYGTCGFLALQASQTSTELKGACRHAGCRISLL
jgi:hypothetical protein